MVSSSPLRLRLHSTILLVLAAAYMGLGASIEPAQADDVTVSDAELRWGINNESNNRAFAPDTYNFFSAGRIADPGKGGTTLPESGWSQHKDAVRIEKWVGTAYRPATWAGLRTDSAGNAIPSPTSGRFSGHTVVLGKGTGVVNRDAGTARIEWDGDFTVIYYSGMTFFYVSDPILTVQEGKGTLTANLSGFASSMEDQSKWTEVPEQRVTIADLPSVPLGDARGLTATPAYDGVKVSGVDQKTDEATFGSFPQSFIDFQQAAGAAPYWYSSGGATDAFKRALPLTVSYDAADAVTPTPVPGTPAPGTPTDNLNNSAPDPPSDDAPNVDPDDSDTADDVDNVEPPTVDEGPAGQDSNAAPTQAMAVRALSTTLEDAQTGNGAVFWWIGGGAMILTSACLTFTATRLPV